MSESLSKWVSQNIDELKFVAEHGRTKTVRAQAKAFLAVLEGNENSL